MAKRSKRIIDEVQDRVTRCHQSCMGTSTVWNYASRAGREKKVDGATGQCWGVSPSSEFMNSAGFGAHIRVTFQIVKRGGKYPPNPWKQSPAKSPKKTAKKGTR